MRSNGEHIMPHVIFFAGARSPRNNKLTHGPGERGPIKASESQPFPRIGWRSSPLTYRLREKRGRGRRCGSPKGKNPILSRSTHTCHIFYDLMLVLIISDCLLVFVVVVERSERIDCYFLVSFAVLVGRFVLCEISAHIICFIIF